MNSWAPKQNDGGNDFLMNLSIAKGQSSHTTPFNVIGFVILVVTDPLPKNENDNEYEYDNDNDKIPKPRTFDDLI